MTQANSQLHHRRTPSSNGSKVRPSRPAFHRKGTSSGIYPISKLGSGQIKRPATDDDHQPGMAASFLNFCAMCERQITVPDNSLLYCSESCRRKDSHKPLSASLPSTASMSYSTSPPTSPPMSPRIIVAPRTPTRVSTKSSAPMRIPTELQDSRVDQDPSEWKPVIPAAPGSNTTGSLASSDAWNYLSQFHGQESSFPNRRYGAGHRSSSSLSTLMSATAPLPSLIHTPSTTASSVSSNASDYMSYAHEPSYRPLPPRHNPYFSGTATATKGVELVVPHVITPTGAVTAVDMSDSGSIFPASSSLWNETATATVSSVVRRKTPSTFDLSVGLRDSSKGMQTGS